MSGMNSMINDKAQHEVMVIIALNVERKAATDHIKTGFGYERRGQKGKDPCTNLHRYKIYHDNN